MTAKKKPPIKKPVAKRGRPSIFTATVAAKICDRLSKGEPLAQICRDEAMPAVRTVGDWKLANADFSASFVRAREEGFDAIAAECFHIADDARNDFVEKMAEEGDEAAVKARAFDAEHVQRSKLRIETRLKLLAKWDPKRYGDKIQQEITGELKMVGMSEKMRARKAKQ